MNFCLGNSQNVFTLMARDLNDRLQAGGKVIGEGLEWAVSTLSR